MARPSTQYVCQQCGAAHSKWSGRCEDCGAWNSLVEEQRPEAPPKGLGTRTGGARGRGRGIDFADLEGTGTEPPRLVTGIGEFDRVTGGGLVPGSALLIGGDPGIGKSTLMLQVAAALTKGKNAKASGRVPGCAYVSGEESIDQLRLRARRLSLEKSTVGLAAATSVRDIAATLDAADPPEAVIIDSIQTMFVDTLESAPGTVAQVRTSAQELIRLAKRRGFCLLIVGHVTKEGQIAGPRILEHMVDTVLYFEGDRGHQFRILRAVKNRFGATDEIGVFEMTDAGLAQVSDPSALFLNDRDGAATGASVFAGLEGSRPLLVEVQALVSPSPLATPRRAVVGWDSGRLAMVLAVLEARCGLTLAGRDVYLNVAGGLKITEPAADLAVAAALVSSVSGVAVPADAVVFGEIGLSGEVRPVSRAEARLKEAAKLGFARAIAPQTKSGKDRKRKKNGGVPEITPIGRLADLLDLFGGGQDKAERPTAAKGFRGGNG